MNCGDKDSLLLSCEGALIPRVQLGPSCFAEPISKFSMYVILTLAKIFSHFTF